MTLARARPLRKFGNLAYRIVPTYSSCDDEHFKTGPFRRETQKPICLVLRGQSG